MDTDTKNYQSYVEEIRLDRYLEVLKRRWLLITAIFALSFSGASWLILKQPDESQLYRSQGKILLKADPSTSLTEVGQDIGRLDPLNRRNNPLDNQASIIQSSSVIERAIAKIPLSYRENEDFSVDTFRENLSINIKKDTDILEVAYDSPDPDLSVIAVNNVMNAYIKRNIALNRSSATSARKFIEQQIPNAKNRRDQAADALGQFEATHQVVDLTRESRVALDEMAALDSTINVLQGRLAAATVKLEEIQRQLNIPLNQARQLEALDDSSAVQVLSEELLKVQTTLADEKSRYTDNFPSVTNLEEKEASLRSLIAQKSQDVARQTPMVGNQTALTLESPQFSELNRRLMNQFIEVQVERLGLVSELQALKDKRQLISNDSIKFPNLKKQQQKLQLAFKIAENNYVKLLERFQEAKLAESQVVSSAEIIETAQVAALDTAQGAGNSRLLLGAGIVGLFLGATAALLLDILDKSVKTISEAEALFNYPLVGSIPPLKRSTVLSKGSVKSVPISSDFFVAYQRLYFNMSSCQSKTQKLGIAIGIVSSVSQEGVSDVCANLAFTMSQSGKRTLLIDANFQNPTQHQRWNISNEKGLFDVLQGNKALSDVLRNVDNNLTILPTGTSVSHHFQASLLTLLESDEMKGLVKTFKEEYDYILFDSSALAERIDSLVLGKILDTLLLVVKPKRLDLPNAISAKSLLDRSEINILGLVEVKS